MLKSIDTFRCRKSAAPRLRPSFSTVSSVALLLLTIAVAGSYSYAPISTILLAAVIAGLSEADNFCGTSHISSFTQFREFNLGPRLWLKCVTAYTIGGLVTAPLIGLALGAVPLGLSFEGVGAIVGLALLLLARELRLVHFPLVQIPRQTHKLWADEFGIVTGAGMWGAHIGIGIATVFQHGGFYLVLIATIVQEPLVGAVVYVCYWLGRTILIWAAPIALQGPDTAQTFEHVFAAENVFRLAASISIVLMTLGVAILAMT